MHTLSIVLLLIQAESINSIYKYKPLVVATSLSKGREWDHNLSIKRVNGLRIPHRLLAVYSCQMADLMPSWLAKYKHQASSDDDYHHLDRHGEEEAESGQ